MDEKIQLGIIGLNFQQTFGRVKCLKVIFGYTPGGEKPNLDFSGRNFFNLDAFQLEKFQFGIFPFGKSNFGCFLVGKI